MSRILVTGASGFLGDALVHRLAVDGAEVVATGRDAVRLQSLPLDSKNVISIDLAALNPDQLPEQFEGVKTIVHCAALSSAWGKAADFYAANVTATEKCLALAKAVGATHFIYVSTPAVYFRFQDQWNVREDMTLPTPVSDYARTKAIAEDHVRDSGLVYTIVRPRAIYGAGDTALMPRLLRAAQSGPLPRFQKGQVQTDMTHVDDVVDALRVIIDNPDEARNQTFNISGGEPLPITEIVQQVCAETGTHVRWRDLPVTPALAAVRVGEWAAKMRPGRPEPRITAYGLGVFAFSQTLCLDNALERLGWRPKVRFEEGLSRTFARIGDAP